MNKWVWRRETLLKFGRKYDNRHFTVIKRQLMTYSKKKKKLWNLLNFHIMNRIVKIWGPIE